MCGAVRPAERDRGAGETNVRWSPSTPRARAQGSRDKYEGRLHVRRRRATDDDILNQLTSEARGLIARASDKDNLYLTVSARRSTRRCASSRARRRSPRREDQAGGRRRGRLAELHRRMRLVSEMIPPPSSVPGRDAARQNAAIAEEVVIEGSKLGVTVGTPCPRALRMTVLALRGTNKEYTTTPRDESSASARRRSARFAARGREHAQEMA